jgi:hypothetical protein
MTKAIVLPATPGTPFTGSTIPRIATPWPGQGGIYAGVMRGEDGLPDYHLIIPAHADAYNASVAWGAPGKDEPGAGSELDGLANTRALVASKHKHPAAEWAASLTIDGHSDLYLPARHELRLAYINAPELFEKYWYWSSTQYAPHPDYAWSQHFSDGFQYGYGDKSYAGRARAVRRLLVIQ